MKTKAEPTLPALTDAALEQIAQDTRKMGHADKIAYWDKRQAKNLDGSYPEGVVLCPHDKSHGALVITGSAAVMICGARKNGAWCTGSMPVSL